MPVRCAEAAEIHPALPSAPQTLTQPPNLNFMEAAMATERTFSIIKPDATRRNLTGKVNAVIEESETFS